MVFLAFVSFSWGLFLLSFFNYRVLLYLLTILFYLNWCRVLEFILDRTFGLKRIKIWIIKIVEEVKVVTFRRNFHLFFILGNFNVLLHFRDNRFLSFLFQPGFGWNFFSGNCNLVNILDVTLRTLQVT